MDHSYSLSCVTHPDISKKRKRAREYNEQRKTSNKRRNRTRINIGVAFAEWRELRDKLGLNRDSALACVLIDSYLRERSFISLPCKRRRMPVQASDRVCGEHYSQDHIHAARRNKGKLRKSTALPKLQTEAEATQSDSSQPSDDSQSTDADDYEDKEVLDINELPLSCSHQSDDPEQTEMYTEGGIELDIVPSENEHLGFVSQNSNSSAATEAEVVHWKDIPAQMEETCDFNKGCATHLLDKEDLNFVSPSSISSAATEEEKIVHWKERKWVINKSSLMGLFRTCNQCREPVQELKTITSGSLIRVQWECTNGHLMWLFPNFNPT